MSKTNHETMQSEAYLKMKYNNMRRRVFKKKDTEVYYVRIKAYII